MTAKRRSRKKPITPYSKIQAVLRRHIWLYSRERKEAIRLACGRCATCGEMVTGKYGKPCEVHHTEGSGMERIIKLIRDTLLNQAQLECLCADCHAIKTKEQREH